MKKIAYVTGCLGFIGGYVTKLLLDKGFYIIGVDKITNVSYLPRLEEFNKYPNFTFSRQDINDIENLLDCDYVINTAAETHVGNSIVQAKDFVSSNINGVYNILELIKNFKREGGKPTLIHFSTDEVYGDIDVGSHTENDLLKPSNPYSSTKAAADMLVCAWARTHAIPYVILRPTNNYGIYQYVEKLIPKTCKYLHLERKIPLHQNGTPKRCWLHAADTAGAVLKVIESDSLNKIYNISGNYEDSNLNIVKKIIKLYHQSDDYEKFLDLSYDRPGQDTRYSVDDSKLRGIKWDNEKHFDLELANIVDFYKNNFIW